MYRVAPALNRPALFSARSSLLQVGKLPEVMDCVELANLDKPGANTLHDLSSSLESPSPVGLPLQQVTGVESV